MYEYSMFFYCRDSDHWRNGVHLAIVACGDRGEETVVLLKSAVLFTDKLLVFHELHEREVTSPSNLKVVRALHELNQANL
jgi:hypothetical protein